MNYAARCRYITSIGCLACRIRGYFAQCDVHHLNMGGKAGQKRRGNAFTIGLCPFHHRGVPLGHLSYNDARAMVGPSLAREPNRFRLLFGSDNSLLETQNRLIAEAERHVIGQRAPQTEAEVIQ